MRRAPGTLWITRGLPASGKTTWALAKVAASGAGQVVRLNRDDLRAMMYGPGYRRPVHAAETAVTQVQQGPIGELLRAGRDVIVDDTNLRAKHVRVFLQLAAAVDAPVEVVDFLDVPVEECVRRDALRPAPVGEDVIREMAGKFLHGRAGLPVPELEPAVSGKPYVPVPGAPRAVIVDIDGTVALHGDRDPYDTSRYHQDGPNEPVIEQVRMAMDAGYTALFTSGRSAEFKDVTLRWLREHVVGDRGAFDLIMRPAGDTRNDAVVKLELFDQHIRDGYDVRWVLDDRDRVVAAWRSIGLPVMQVAPGAF